MPVDADCLLLFHKTASGESEDKDYPDAVQVQGWKWGASYSNRGIAGDKGGHGDLKNFVFWHYLDSASPILLHHCEKGMTIPLVTLMMRRQGGTAQKFIEITFNKVRVISIEMESTPTMKLPLEHVELAFNKVNFEYMTQSQEGRNSSRGAVSFNWIAELFG